MKGIVLAGGSGTRLWQYLLSLAEEFVRKEKK